MAGKAKGVPAGRAGEDAAAAYLTARGARILERNFRCRFGEIDLIAEQGGLLLFVEVKTRKPGALSGALESVGAEKRRRICRTAMWYLQQRPAALQPRFDVACATVLPNGEAVVADYLENAFSLEDAHALF